VPDLFDRRRLQDLIDGPGTPVVLILMPTGGAGADREDAIRLRNLLDDAERRLVASGMRATDARTLLAPGHDLLPPPTGTGRAPRWTPSCSGCGPRR
jgi:hypothetical protein